MNTTIKYNKGQTGLTFLLSLIVMLFVIGLMVMIFSLMGSGMRDASYTSTTGSVVNETLITVTGLGENFAVSNYRNVVCVVDTTKIYNSTDSSIIGATNYTITGCNIKSITSGSYNNTNWKVTYTYTYDADNTATDTINETNVAIAGVTSWFDIFMVIGAMVVLIILVVLIITSIRSSGITESGTNSNKNLGVGTA